MRVSEIHDESIRELRILLKSTISEKSKEDLRKMIREFEKSKAEIKVDLDIDRYRPRGYFGRYGGGGC